MAQQELTDTAGLSKTTIQRIENAKYSIAHDTLVAISEALEMLLKG